MSFYGEILAPLCSDDPHQILVNFWIFCVALVGHNGYQFLAPNLHQYKVFLTKTLSRCHTRLYSITIVRFNDCDGDEKMMRKMMMTLMMMMMTMKMTTMMMMTIKSGGVAVVGAVIIMILKHCFYFQLCQGNEGTRIIPRYELAAFISFFLAS